MGNNFQIPKQTPLKPINKQAKTQVQRQIDKDVSFNNLLQQKLKNSALKFSAHAQKRLTTNGVSMNDNQMLKLEQAVAKAEQKGCKESLIVINDMAFVVSVNNKTVITAVDQGRMKDNVFTNIDSAVIS